MASSGNEGLDEVTKNLKHTKGDYLPINAIP